MKIVSREKIVLVTGSSRGLGFHIARYFSERGATVIINGRDKNTLIAAATDLGNNVIGFAADVCEPDGARSLVDFVAENYGRLDTVVCNVGSGTSVQPGKENYAEWQRVFSKNFFSTTNVVEAATDLLSKAKGSIVCISSICGRQIIANAPVTYSCSKSALNTGYPKSLEIKDFPEPIPPIIPTLIMFNSKSHSFIFLEIQLIRC